MTTLSILFLILIAIILFGVAFRPKKRIDSGSSLDEPLLEEQRLKDERLASTQRKEQMKRFIRPILKLFIRK